MGPDRLSCILDLCVDLYYRFKVANFSLPPQRTLSRCRIRGRYFLPEVKLEGIVTDELSAQVVETIGARHTPAESATAKFTVWQ